MSVLRETGTLDIKKERKKEEDRRRNSCEDGYLEEAINLLSGKSIRLFVDLINKITRQTSFSEF